MMIFNIADRQSFFMITYMIDKPILGRVVLRL